MIDGPKESRAAAALAAGAVAAALAWTYAHGAQWYPDTRHYAVRTLEILGRSRAEAKEEAGAFLLARGVTNPISVVDSPHARMFHPRVLYPLLSAPFVAAGGLEGLLVVPLVATIVAFLLLWRVTAARAPPWTAAAVVVAVAAARTVRLYGLAALSDGLALALAAAAVAAFPSADRPRGSPRVAFAVALAAGLTREIAPFLVLAALGGLLAARRGADEALREGWRRTAIAVAVAAALSLAWTAAVARLGVLAQIEFLTGRAGTDALRVLPEAFARALGRTGSALVRDWPLLAVFVAAAIAAVRRAARTEASLAAGAAIAAIGLLVVNPVATKFRLQLPLVPFAAILAARLGEGAREGPEPASAPPL